MDASTLESQVRRDQLRAWILAYYPNTRSFCLAHGFNASEISQLLRQKSFGSRRARRIESVVGMPFRYLEGISDLDSAIKRARGQGSAQEPIDRWPFKLASYGHYLLLTQDKKRELDIRVAEFMAGAISDSGET